MSIKKTLLEKLEAKQKKLNEEIKAAKKKEAEKQATLHLKRCEIIGEAIIKELEASKEFESYIKPVLEKNIQAAQARKLLGLAPLPKKDKKPPTGSTDPGNSEEKRKEE